MAKKLGVAILGTGGIAATHIDSYKKFPQSCEIRAVCDLYPEKAEKLAAEKGIAAAVYSDYKELVNDPGIDLVSVCLPPSMHCETATAFLNAGKHVLTEKPMAASLAECDSMIEASKKSGALLAVVAQNRYKIPIMKVKALIDSGRYGRLLHTTVASYWWRGRRYYDLWWRGTWEKEGGGCTLNHAVHHIDLVRWIAGMPQEISGVITNVSHDNSETEDLSVAILKYADGSLAQVTASLVAHGEKQEMAFHTEKACLTVPWEPKVSRAKENGFSEDDDEGLKKLMEEYDALEPIENEGHLGQIGNFLSAIEGKEPLLVDGVEGRQTLELIMGLYKASVTRMPVRFPLSADDPVYTKEGVQALMPRFHEKTGSIENFSTSAITLGRDVGK